MPQTFNKFYSLCHYHMLEILLHKSCGKMVFNACLLSSDSYQTYQNDMPNTFSE